MSATAPCQNSSTKRVTVVRMVSTTVYAGDTHGIETWSPQIVYVEPGETIDLTEAELATGQDALTVVPEENPE